jgi:hypothetical protein
MRYSVRDFLVYSLLLWIFSEKHPLSSTKYAAGTFVIILVPKYAKFKEWLKKGAGLHEHRGKLNRDKTTYKISTYIAVLPDYKGFDWVFATNIKYEKIFRYMRYYKKRWGIETTFRVQDKVKIKTKTLIPEIRSHSSYLSACCTIYGSSSRGMFRSGDLLTSCSGGAVKRNSVFSKTQIKPKFPHTLFLFYGQKLHFVFIKSSHLFPFDLIYPAVLFSSSSSA